jgi:hypothetical protein
VKDRINGVPTIPPVPSNVATVSASVASSTTTAATTTTSASPVSDGPLGPALLELLNSLEYSG